MHRERLKKIEVERKTAVLSKIKEEHDGRGGLAVEAGRSREAKEGRE